MFLKRNNTCLNQKYSLSLRCVKKSLLARIPFRNFQKLSQISFPHFFYRLNINFFTDEAFESQFGDSASGVIKKVVSYAQNILQWPSLTTKVAISIEAIYRISGEFDATDDNT